MKLKKIYRSEIYYNIYWGKHTRMRPKRLCVLLGRGVAGVEEALIVNLL